jgi:hypothetical protein
MLVNDVTTSADSDRDGAFRLPTVARSVPLRVKAATSTASSDWVEVGSDQDRVVVRLTGAPSGALTGVLVAPGQPLAGRAIAILDGAAASPDEMAPLAVTQTKAGGLFEIETLPSGRYTLWVYRAAEDPSAGDEPTWAEQTTPVVIRPNEVTDVTVVLAPEP